MDKELEKKSNDIVICPSCGTINSMENEACTRCKYKLKTWTTYEQEVELKNEVSKKKNLNQKLN